MKKLLIPGVTLGAVLIALAFVVAPVQEATAIHTSVQANTMRHFVLTAIVSPDTGADDAVDEQATWTINQPFHVVASSITFTVVGGNNCNLGVTNIRTDMFAETSGVSVNPAIVDVEPTDTRALIDRIATDGAVFGNVVLSIALVEEATCAADTRGSINTLITTTGALTTAPTAVIGTTTAAKGGGLAGD